MISYGTPKLRSLRESEVKMRRNRGGLLSHSWSGFRLVHEVVLIRMWGEIETKMS